MTVSVYGTDVSNWNRPPWPQLPTAFVFAKATEGLRFNDPSYATWRARARKAGKVFGAYHFARPDNGNSATKEAAHFLTFAKLAPGDLAILDIEVMGGNLAAWVEEWCAFVELHAQCDVVVYTNGSVGAHLENSGHRPLWIADPSHRPESPAVPQPWHHWTIHQYGTASGFDRNVTNGLSAGGLKALGCHTLNAHRAPAVKAESPQRRDLIAARNALARLFYLAHVPWTAKA